jgi:FkbM family methyltransferase
MPSFTTPKFLALRRFLRVSGLATPMSLLLGRGGYERRFNARLLSSVRGGNRVWDIGANIGYYTKQFAALSGKAGRVFAFEPSPINAARLRQATASLPNVTTIELALSDRNGKVAFSQGDDELGATSRVLSVGENLGNQSNMVQMATGDDVIAQGWAEVPNVIKIDVEGHELEVLRGLGSQLSRHDLMHVFVEVHFGLLDHSGRSDVPSKIVSLLETSGFHVTWIDPSHLHATRA